jgi:hypothetical protein
MILSIQSNGKIITPTKNDFDYLFVKKYRKLKSIIQKIKNDVDKNYYNASFEIYPPEVTKIKFSSVFIGSPMASITEENEYKEIVNIVEDVTNYLHTRCKLIDIYSATSINKTLGEWDGTLAVYTHRF